VKRTELVTSLLKEFRTFVLRANAVDLAIAVALGAAFTAVVQAIVTDLFTPLISAIAGSSNFAKLSFNLRGSTFSYGLVINALIALLSIAAILFFLVVKPMNALRRRHDRGATPPPKGLCPACFTEIDARSRRCPACTEVLAEGWATEI